MQVITTHRSHSLESLGVSISKELILERLNKLKATKGGSPNLLPHFDRFMGEKKMHEVSGHPNVTSTKISLGLFCKFVIKYLQQWIDVL